MIWIVDLHEIAGAYSNPAITTVIAFWVRRLGLFPSHMSMTLEKKAWRQRPSCSFICILSEMVQLYKLWITNNQPFWLNIMFTNRRPSMPLSLQYTVLHISSCCKMNFCCLCLADHQRNWKVSKFSFGESDRKWKELGITLFLFGMAVCGIWSVYLWLLILIFIKESLSPCMEAWLSLMLFMWPITDVFFVFSQTEKKEKLEREENGENIVSNFFSWKCLKQRQGVILIINKVSLYKLLITVHGFDL